MPSYCSVQGCKSNRAHKSPSVPVHYFPLNIPAIAEKWKSACGRGENFVPAKHHVICRKHFTKNDFQKFYSHGSKKMTKKKLKDFAYPTMYLPTAETKSSVEHDHMRMKPSTSDHLFDEVQFNTSDDENHGHQHKEVAAEVEIEADVNELLRVKIQQLEAEKQELLSKNEALEGRNKDLEELKSEIHEAVSTVYSEDEIYRLKSKKFRKKYPMKRYPSAAMMKAIKTYYTCGTAGYKHLLKQGQPWPSVRTIQRHLKKVPFDHGTLDAIIEKLKPKVAAMHPNDRIIALVVDELHLEARREYDSSTGSFVGHPTIPARPQLIKEREKQGIHQTERLATSGYAVMICGIHTRFKQLVGFEYTEKSVDQKIVKAWLISLIAKLQSIGFKVRSLTLDMGPGNQGL